MKLAFQQYTTNCLRKLVELAEKDDSVSDLKRIGQSIAQLMHYNAIKHRIHDNHCKTVSLSNF